MAKSIKIKSAEVLSDNFFQLKKIDYEVENKKGSVEEVSREVYFSANGATVLLYNRQTNNVILTQQFRLPAFLNKHPTGMMIETCAGILEDDEEPAAGIKREIEEETGYKVDTVKKIFSLYSTPGSVAERIHYFVAEYEPTQKVGEGGGLDDEKEDIAVIELPFEDAFIKIQSGEIVDAKTVILLQYARIYLFQEEKVFDLL